MFEGVNDLQELILGFISAWADTNRDPIPQRVIVVAMGKKGVPGTTVVASLRSLIRKGYIRKTVRSACYVQLRTSLYKTF